MSDIPSGRAARLSWHAHDSATQPIEAAPAERLATVHHRASAEVFDCPLSSLGGDFDGETWHLDDAVTHGDAHGWRYALGADLAFAALHIDDGERSDTPRAIEQAAFDAYTQLFALQRTLGLAHVQRIWHWVSAVTAGAGDDQRYKRFCRGRAEALDQAGGGPITLPPATLVSGSRRGIRLHALLGDTPITPIENPRQISAYDYPREYGTRAPAFARGGRVRLAATDYLLISGTASIVGHESRHPGDTAAQAHEALNNIEAVMHQADAWADARGLAALECLKAYIRTPADASVVAPIVARRAPGVPLAMLHAPLCRDDLLVEFEAQMPLHA